MKIIIIDDDKLVCISLRTILQEDEEIEVAAIGNSGEDAVRLYEQYRPDIMLMDIQMEGMGGLEAGKKIISRFPMARLVYLTTFSDNDYIISALRIGAKGYLIKQNVETIPYALKAVMNGQSVFGSEVVNKLPELMSAGRKFEWGDYDINEREKSVIELVAKGMNNKEIADRLYLSEGTVRNYISVILEKLKLRDRTQLAVFYLERD